MALTGKPVDRIDGQLKVTGEAKYAAEFNKPDMVYAFPIRSTIGNGTITGFDLSDAKKSGGVIAILTYENAPRLQAIVPEELMKTGGALGENVAPLQDNKVNYFGEYIGVVIAETFEQARTGAELVKVSYDKKPVVIDLKTEVPKGNKPEKNYLGEPAQTNEGQAAQPLAVAAVKMENAYTTPTENQHPMEPHATMAIWDGPDKITLHHSAQGVLNARAIVSYFFNLKPENVRVLAPYIGGGFGAKGLEWPHLAITAMAAKTVSRPVKLVLTRQMMQTNTGRRAPTIQNVALGAEANGKLAVIRHHTDSYNNLTQFFETSGELTKVLYSAPVREITYRLARLNMGAPTFMRAPGEASGSFALESALDEMAHQLKMDPLQLRITNHTTIDPIEKHQFSSEYLLECYRIGAEKFGWQQRKMQPRENRKGKQLIGYGMATATYPAARSSAAVRIQLMGDRKVKVMSATQDLGTGTYTIMAQTASDALGVPIERITVEIGDSNLPPAPLSAGSQTAASVNPAVMSAGGQLLKDLMQLATADPKSNLKGKNPEEITFADGKFYLKDDTTQSDSYLDIMMRNNKNIMEACVTTVPATGSGLGPKGAPCMPAPAAQEENSDAEKYSFHSFGAHFVEVWVDEDFGSVRVKRFTTVQDVGLIMNEKTARSQIIGGVIYGIGQALTEETDFDERWGNPVTRTLGDYHVPVHLDVPDIDVHFIGKPDPHISPIGARGAGEIGGVGVAAAIANAVFNATGKRIRSLPITLDKLL